MPPVRSHQVYGQDRPKTGPESPARGPEARLSDPNSQMSPGATGNSHVCTVATSFIGASRVSLNIIAPGPMDSYGLGAIDVWLDDIDGPKPYNLVLSGS